MMLVIDDSGIIQQTLLPQIMINDCYTNKILKNYTFLDKYKIEYSEFECKQNNKD